MTKNWRGEIAFPVGEVGRARLAKGITTQGLLAEHVRIRREVVSDAEKGKHISPEHAQAIALGLGLDLSKYQQDQDTGGLIGRNAEIGLLMRALDDPNPVRCLVMGGPGIGKTALTTAAASIARVDRRYASHRVWFAALETAGSAGMAKLLIIQALGLDPGKSAFEDAVALLSQGPGLLILDNLETPWESDAQDLTRCLETVFREAPQLAVLGSIRGRESPASGWTQKVLLRPLTYGASSKLFRNIATQISQRDADLAPFLEALGGMPLAIKLVAQRAEPYDSLARLWREWTAGPVGISLANDPMLPESRSTSVLRSVAFSLQSPRLHEEGRRLFRLLGLSPAGMAARDYEALLGPAAMAAERQLLAVGLAEQRSSRLDLLPPVRDAARHLAPATESEELAWREHYVQLVNEHGLTIGRKGGAEAAAILAPEFGNLNVAITDSIGQLLPGQDLFRRAPRAVVGMFKLLSFTGVGRSDALAELAREFEKGDHASHAAECFARLGDIAFRRSELDDSERHYQRAIPIFRQAENWASLAHCLEWLGDVARERMAYGAAEKLSDEAIALYRKSLAQGQQVEGIDDTYIELGLADAIWSKGELYRMQFRWDESAREYEEALRIINLHDSLRGRANCIRGFAYLSLAAGDLGGAKAKFQQALELYEQISGLTGAAHCWVGLGKVHHLKTEFEQALEHYEQALRLFRQIRNRVMSERCSERMAQAKAKAALSEVQL